MWRHSLLLRYKPSFRIFADPALSLINETRCCLNPKLFVKSVCTKKQNFFPARCYSKVASEVLPEINLEVSPTPSEANQSSPRPTPVLKDIGTDSEGKLTQNNVQAIHEDIKYTASEFPQNDRLKHDITESDEIDLEGASRLVTSRHSSRPRPSSSENEPNSEHKLSLNHVTSIDKPMPTVSQKPNKTDVENFDLNVKSTRKEVIIDKNYDMEDEPMFAARSSRPRPRHMSRGPEDRTPEKQRSVQEQMLFEEIENKSKLSSEQWDKLRKQVVSAGSVLSNENIDTAIMGMCMDLEQLDTGLSYMNYLSALTQEPNVSTIARFFRLALLCSSDVNDNIQSIITSLYDSLRLRHPVFDASTADGVIQGLAVTKRWKEGLEILDELRLTSTPNSFLYSVLIKASFDNNEPDTGWELMFKMVQEKKKPNISVYEAWLQYCRKFAAGDKIKEQKLVERLLNFLANYDIRLTENEVKLIRLWFEYEAPPEADWNVQYTTVDTRGMCKSCYQYLSNIAVTVQEFEALKSVFIEKALIHSNIFLKSTPEELQEFDNFVRTTAPYDVVIDGLNVGYSTNGKGNPKLHGRMLKSVVQYFVERSQKVLVLGRRHMYNWSKDSMEYVYQNAEVFLTQNTSQDDPYLLYAAMYSGLGTRFISRDLMRSHSYVLKDPTLQSSFTRWQKKYQLQVAHIGDDGNVKFRLQPKFDTSVQRNKYGSWHIPYNLQSDSTRNQSFNFPRQWLCLSHFKENMYDRGNENDSFEFTNTRHENRGYDRNSMPSHFRKNTQRRFDDTDDESGSSQFGKSNYRNRGFDGDKMSRFRQTKPAAQNRYDDDDEEPPQFTKHGPRGVNPAFEDDEEPQSPQFRKGRGRYVDQRFGGEVNTNQTFSRPYGQDMFDDDIQSMERFKPKYRSASKMSDGDDSSDEQTFKSKQVPSNKKIANEMFQSESKQDFKANRNRTQQKPVKKYDDWDM